MISVWLEVIESGDPGASSFIAAIEWPFQFIPRPGDQLYGFGIEEALGFVEVTSVSFNIQDKNITIFCEPGVDEYENDFQDAADIFKRHGWEVQMDIKTVRVGAQRK